ncbi:MAG: histidinol dehydrogenase [Verrucomicrobiota bacterium]
MRVLRSTDKTFADDIADLCERPAFDQDIEEGVKNILRDIRQNGDKAVSKYAEKYDSVKLSPSEFPVPDKMIHEANRMVSSEIRDAVIQAHRQIKDFSSRQLPEPWSYAPRKGVIVGERYHPLERVAVYVPGGTAPLISTVLHTVTLAAVAGVPEIVVTTPADEDKNIHPALLYAAEKAGATEVYRLGGVYAIGAFAYGTESISKVDKIVGPGNAYVTAAKKEVYGHTDLDMVAGPSEIMIIADDSARAEFIAADMLSQLEHGSGRESAVVVTTDEDLIAQVQEELEKQKKKLKRIDYIDKCIDSNVCFVKVDDRETAVDVASRYAPEHLEIIARKPGALAKKVRAAGAVFLGPWTPEPVGDFVAGPSHVLPTGGSARFFSGLTADQFCRRISVVHYQEQALTRELDMITEIAAAEGLDAHAESAKIRVSEK